MHWHEHKHACHQYISKYTYMHIHGRYTGSNPTEHKPPEAKLKHNTQLATQIRQNRTKNEALLAN